MGLDLDTIGYFLFMEKQEKEERGTEEKCDASDDEQQNESEEDK